MLRGLEEGVMLGQLLDPPPGANPRRPAKDQQQDPLAAYGLPAMFGAADQQLQALGGGRTTKAGQQENLSRGGGDEAYGGLAAIANDAVGGGASSKIQRGIGPSGMRADRDPSAPRGFNR